MVRVTFLHPDLGIGGAERAVIDAALALKSVGHSVHFVTAHHDPRHCFPETKDGSFKVTTAGDWLPRSLFGRCYALCAYIRMCYAALYLVIFSGIVSDLVFCDQIAACIPILRLCNVRVLFYCHFPDMLLTQRQTFIKRLYRAPIDRLEEWTTGLAHCVLVNSKFTANVFRETFTSLQHIEPQVLYPIPNFAALNEPVTKEDLQFLSDLLPATISTLFISINRYERKKNLPLAIEALDELRNQRGSLDNIHLVVAGGYDERVVENRKHYLELRHLVDQLELDAHVTFIRSFTDAQKRVLLSHASCLLYTPDREHFGIVPIESMYLKTPVVAIQSGGPLETVGDRETGFLCLPDASEFAKHMIRFVEDKNLSTLMGVAGKKRVEEKFAFATFTRDLDTIVRKVIQSN